MRRGLAIAFAFALLVACGGESPDAPAADDAPTTDVLARTTEEGPVKATVTLSPTEPRVGDRLALTLEVDAAPGAAVEMPSFGEALGRFAIVDFAPRQSATADGARTLVQRYTLQSPGSGRHRIPPLRLEWTDDRPDGDGETRELLTEELAVQVASVLEEDLAEQKLRPAPEPLEAVRAPLLSRLWPVLAAAAAAALLAVAFVLWRRAARTRTRITAYDRAMERLAVLQRGGLPGPGEADMWYVELSAIVRRYLEDRFSLRAPELTTEEFLREARRSRELSAEHQRTLSSFLALCDRVKFAGHEPDDRESQEAIDAARRFLDDTRAAAEDTSSRAPSRAA